jgi:hypothetical protein
MPHVPDDQEVRTLTLGTNDKAWFRIHKNVNEGDLERWASEALGIMTGAGGLASARVPRRLKARSSK